MFSTRSEGRSGRGGLAFWLGLALICTLGMAQGARAQSITAPLVKVTFQDGDTLRALCEAQLADPDLWPLVLKLSGVARLTDLRPGVVLVMPVAQVKATDGALAEALTAIQAANAQGARLFAPEGIEAAISSHADAVLRRGEGAWAAAVKLANTATAFANEALAISLAQRDRAAEALVTDVQGQVEGRDPQASRWTARALNDTLVQYERLRTLSGSTTQVTFRDLSRLRLNPNSNATIQRMRSDPVTGGEVTKIELVSGDFYALLNQLGERTSFEIDVAGLETRTDSADFWVKTDDSGARFANYDAAALVVGRGAQAVSLGENEGAVVDAAGAARVTEVLDRPAPLAPADRGQVFGRSAALSWAAMPAAAGYWLEVAADAGFNDMRVSEWGIADTGFAVAGLDQGDYHWRVAALDSFGLPGTWSLASGFTLILDETPPFLAVASPAEGALLAEAGLTLAGETEAGVTLTLDAVAVPVGADARFAVGLTAVPGPNSFTLVATDVAGNVTTRVVSVVFRPKEALAITPDAALPRDAAGRFLTATDQLAFVAASGAAPGAAVRVTDAAGAMVVQGAVAEGGAISLTLPAGPAPRDYEVAVLSPLGAVEGAVAIAVLADATPPAIAFDPAPPQATAQAALSVTGTVGDAVAASVNGRAVPVTAGRIVVEAVLQPGPNLLQIAATDLVGNVALRSVGVILDATPPTLGRVQLTRPEGAAGVIEITAEARDAGGLRAAGRYRIAVDGKDEAGVLRCDADSGLCRATLPPRAGDVRLIGVTVQDYAGNAAGNTADGN